MTTTDELTREIESLRAQLTHVYQKIAHGCTDALCPECDANVPQPYAAQPLPPAPRDGDGFKCECGCTRFRYLEDIQNARRVEGIDGDLLHVDGFYETDGFDDGDNPRIMCSECCAEYALPEGIEVEFV